MQRFPASSLARPRSAQRRLARLVLTLGYVGIFSCGGSVALAQAPAAAAPNTRPDISAGPVTEGPRERGPQGSSRGREVWVFDLVNRDSTLEELKLTDDQRKKIDDLAKEFDAERDALRGSSRGRFGGPGSASPQEMTAAIEEARKKSDDLRKRAEAKLRGVLQPEQFLRYEQLQLHTSGPSALLREDVADTLQLTPEQRAAMRKLQDDYQGKSVSRDERDKARADRDAALVAALTAEQKLAWEKKLGSAPKDALASMPGDATTAAVSTASNPTPAVSASAAPASGAPASGAPASGAPASGAPAIGAAPAVAAPAEEVVAEFGSGAGRTAAGSTRDGAGKTGAGQPTSSADAKASAARASRSNAPHTAASDEKQLSFNFRFAPWEMVLKRFAQEAGLTLDMSDVPPGTFNYYDTGTYSATAALDILNGYLLRKGFALVRQDRFLIVVNIDHGIPPNLVPQVSIQDLPSRGRNELLSVVIPLTNLDPKTAAEEVKELLGPQGKVVPLTRANQVFVTDIGANLQRVHELLTGLGEVLVVKGTNFRAIKLVHVSAHEAERMVRDLFNLPVRGAATVRSTATTDQAQSGSGDSGRSRWGRGDWGGFGGGGWGGRGDFGGGGGWGGRGDRGSDRGGSGPPTAQPGTSGAAGAAQQPVAKIQITADSRTNSLMVVASADDIALVEQAIKSIDVAEQRDPRGSAEYSQRSNLPQLEVYALESADLQTVINVLNSTLPGLIVHEDAKSRRLNIYATASEHEAIRNIVKQIDSGAGESVAVVQLRRLEAPAAAVTLRALFTGTRQDGPTIEADAAGRRLMVRGTPEQIAQIRKMVQELDGPGDAADPVARGPYRTLSPGGRTPEEIVSLVQRVLSNDKQVFIRVVPSSAISTPAFQLPDSDDKMRRGSTNFDRKLPSRPKSAEGSRKEREKAEASPEKLPEQLPVVKPSKLQPAKEAARPGPSARRASGITFLASQSEPLPETQEAPAQDRPAEELPISKKPSEKQAVESAPSTSADAPASGSEVRISTYDGKIVLYSDDMNALDKVERFVQSITRSASPKTKWTVYYLRAADANETVTMLNQLFPMGTTSSSSSSYGGYGSSSSSSSSDLGSLGQAATTLRIIPETRSNALFISGPEGQVNQVLEALTVLDATELPESLKDRLPRMIAVEHADVDDVAAIVRDVYREQMEQPASNGQNGGNRGGGGFNPMDMFSRGGMWGGGMSQQSNSRSQRPVQLSIGVDNRTNQLVVSANDQMFRQVESLVKALDESALEANRTVRVVTLEKANSLLVQQALSSLMGKVKVSTTGDRGQQPQPQQNASQPGSFDSNASADFQQRMRERMQRRSGSDGSSSNNSFNGGPSTGGGDQSGGRRRRGGFGGGGDNGGGGGGGNRGDAGSNNGGGGFRRRFSGDSGRNSN